MLSTYSKIGVQVNKAAVLSILLYCYKTCSILRKEQEQ